MKLIKKIISIITHLNKVTGKILNNLAKKIIRFITMMTGSFIGLFLSLFLLSYILLPVELYITLCACGFFVGAGIGYIFYYLFNRELEDDRLKKEEIFNDVDRMIKRVHEAESLSIEEKKEKESKILDYMISNIFKLDRRTLISLDEYQDKKKKKK